MKTLTLLGLGLLVTFGPLTGCSKERSTYQPIELAPHDVRGGYRVEFVNQTDPEIDKLQFHKRFLGTLCRPPRHIETSGLANTWVYEFKDHGKHTLKAGQRSGYAIIHRTGLFRVAEWHTADTPFDSKALKTAARDVMHRYGCKSDWDS